MRIYIVTEAKTGTVLGRLGAHDREGAERMAANWWPGRSPYNIKPAEAPGKNTKKGVVIPE